MSFSAKAKNEITGLIPQKLCCMNAECYGILLFAKNFSLDSVTFTTENSIVAKFTAEMASQLTGAIVDTTSVLTRRKSSSNTFTVSAVGRDECKKILNGFSHTGKEISLRVNNFNLLKSCCFEAFLRGVFLSCGSVIDPQKDYHLEFLVPHMNLAKDLVSLLTQIDAIELLPAMIPRKGNYVVYIKGSDQIADLLTFLGASQAAMELMQVKMLKEVRNNVNRKMNFETANIDKTVNASSIQIYAIEKIANSVGYDQLPEELQELAQLRLENPEMSLRELGENLAEPISRSGVNHRLKRILEFAEHLN